MKNLISTAFFAVLLLLGCKTDPSQQQNSTATTENTAKIIDPASIQLLCQAVTVPNDQADAPRHEVYLQIGDTRVKIADILNCASISSENYGQFQIPDGAISACGGWWAGAGDYFFVVEEGGNYVVKQGGMDEQAESNDYGYKAIMTFNKSGEEVF